MINPGYAQKIYDGLNGKTWSTLTDYEVCLIFCRWYDMEHPVADIHKIDIDREVLLNDVYNFNTLYRFITSQPSEFFDGVSMATELEAIVMWFMSEHFNFCQCGNPNGMIEFVNDILSCFTYSGDGTSNDCGNGFSLIEVAGIDHYRFDALTGAKDGYSIFSEFILKWLDSVGLTQHGSSIGGSWLDDPVGLLAKEAFRRYLKLNSKEV